MAPSKQVSFDSIEVVEHSMILGDHPACRIGPPVQMSWNMQRRDSYSVDEFEETRSPNRRRSADDLVLTSAQRRRLIIAAQQAAEEDDDQSESSALSSLSGMSETDILLQHMSEKTDELVHRMHNLDEGIYMMGVKRRHRRRREARRTHHNSSSSRGASCRHAIRPAGLTLAGIVDVPFEEEN